MTLNDFFILVENDCTNNLISGSINTNMNVELTATSDHIESGIFEKSGKIYLSKLFYYKFNKKKILDIHITFNY